MRTRSIILTAIAAATFVGLGGAVATPRPAADAHPALMLMGVGNPHGAAPAVAPEAAAERQRDLEAWTELYSRDVWPGMGVANVHAAR